MSSIQSFIMIIQIMILFNVLFIPSTYASFDIECLAYTCAQESEACCPTDPSIAACEWSSSCNFEVPDDGHCKLQYEQCGGNGYTGETCCKSGFSCYGTSWPPAPCATGDSWCACGEDPNQSSGCSSAWAQCGGDGFAGPTCCNHGYICVYDSPAYSQCLPVQSTTSDSCCKIKQDIGGCPQGNDCTSDNIICIDDMSCYNANSLTGKYSVECSGKKSCRGTNTITVTDETSGIIECNGYSSCADTSIVSSRDVKCGGKRSCAQSVITAANDIFVTGQYAVKTATIFAGRDIIITTNYGASGAKSLNAAGDVTITAAFGAEGSRIRTGNEVTCAGRQSCASTKRITSSSNSLIIEYNGNKAGKNSNVYCPKSGTCRVICTEGCDGTTMIYYPRGTDLQISPSECAADNANRPSSTCPALKMGRKDEYDEWLKAAEEEDLDDVEFAVDSDDDFMAFIGMRGMYGNDREYGLQSGVNYVVYGLMVFIFVMFIGASVYYYKEQKAVNGYQFDDE